MSVRHIFFLCFLLVITACSKKKPAPEAPPGGKVSFVFEHYADGKPLVTDTPSYINAAGNRYMVYELMYFISDVTFYPHKGDPVMISQWEDIFYIDIDIPSTLEQRFFDPLPAGLYDSVSFVFGMTGEKNIPFMYTNPPEVNMSWPQVLGGGYHYMMLNGKWFDLSGILKPFDFHMGIGQLYRSNVIHTDSIYAFVQNWFRVSLPGSSFMLGEDETRQLRIRMNIDSWFATPHVYDHNTWGGAIMQIQPAMQMAKENGYDVFSYIREDI